MAFAPIYNPPVPYIGYIDGGFGLGRMVRIRGSTSPSAKRFAINLQCGPKIKKKYDIALHLSPRFDKNFITRSSLQHKSWRSKENHGPMPLRRGQPFEILLLCNPDNYKIAVNGQHFSEYKHHVPYSRVTHITVNGDVTLSLVAFEDGSVPPPQLGNDVRFLEQPWIPYMPHHGAQPKYGGGLPYPGPQSYGGFGQPPPLPEFNDEFGIPALGKGARSKGVRTSSSSSSSSSSSTSSSSSSSSSEEE